MTVTLLAGCATSSHKVTTVDPTTNVSTTTSDKSSQPDNSALTVIGEGVKIIGDVVTAVLPPLIPVVVGGLTHPVVSTNSIGQ